MNFQDFCDKKQIAIESRYIPWTKSGDEMPSLNWEVTLFVRGKNVLTTPYRQGMGFCKKYKGKNSVAEAREVEYECMTPQSCIKGKYTHEPPTLESVLECMLLDAQAIDYPSYEEFASDCGYDEDSRAGEKIYLNCLKTGLAMRCAIGDDDMYMLRTLQPD